MCTGSEPVEVRKSTESFAELARHWAEPQIAGMYVVLLVAMEGRLVGDYTKSEMKHAWKYCSFPGKRTSSRPVILRL